LHVHTEVCLTHVCIRHTPTIRPAADGVCTYAHACKIHLQPMQKPPTF
jgi:hypothetical protein